MTMPKPPVVVRLPPLAALALALCLAALGLVGCAGSATPVDTTGFSAPRIVQAAQAAADRGDYELALVYYRQIRERFPTDTERVMWADYEIAFLHHKMGNDEEAIRLFDALIAAYGETPDPSFPPGPRILAGKVRENLVEAAEQAKARAAKS